MIGKCMIPPAILNATLVEKRFWQPKLYHLQFVIRVQSSADKIYFSWLLGCNDNVINRLHMLEHDFLKHVVCRKFQAKKIRFICRSFVY
jgi:hypothetical protein